MLQLAKVQNKTLDANILAKDVQDIIKLDYLLATKFSTDDTTRRQYDRSYNPNTLTQLLTQYHNDVFRLGLLETSRALCLASKDCIKP